MVGVPPSSSPSSVTKPMKGAGGFGKQHLESERGRHPPDPNGSHGRKVWLSLLSCVSYFSIGCTMGLLGPAIPALAKTLGVGVTAMGGVFATRAVGYILGSLSVGWFGSWPVVHLVAIMAASGFVSATINAIIPYLEHLWLLMTLCLVQGVGLSIISTVGNIVLLQIWRKRSGVWLQCLHSAFGLGAVASPLVLGVTGIRLTFFTVAGVAWVPMVGLILDQCTSSLLRGGHRHTPQSSQAGLGLGGLPPDGSNNSHKGDEGNGSRRWWVGGPGGGLVRSWLRRMAAGGLGLGRRENSWLGHEPMRAAAGEKDGITNDTSMIILTTTTTTSSSSGSSPGQNQQQQEEEDNNQQQGSNNHRAREEGTARTMTHGGGGGGAEDLEGTAASKKQQLASTAPPSKAADQQQQEATTTMDPPRGAAASSHHQHHHVSSTSSAALSSHYPQYYGSSNGEWGGLHNMVIGCHDDDDFDGLGADNTNNCHSRFASNTSDITLFTFSSNPGHPLAPATTGPPHVHAAAATGASLAALLSPAAVGPSTSSHHHDHHDAASSCCSVGGQHPNPQLGGSVHGGTSVCSFGGGSFIPMPTVIRLLLTLFFGFYVGAEVGFGGWVASYVLMEGTVTSEREAAFLVAIFWACITGGRVVAVFQSMHVSAATSLRVQLLLSLAGAILFFIVGGRSPPLAIASAVAYGYGMSSIYPMTMAWPTEAGLLLDPRTTTHLVIGGCVGEALVPVVIGELMNAAGAMALPMCILVLVLALLMIQVAVPLLAARAHSEHRKDAMALAARAAAQHHQLHQQWGGAAAEEGELGEGESRKGEMVVMEEEGRGGGGGGATAMSRHDAGGPMMLSKQHLMMGQQHAMLSSSSLMDQLGEVDSALGGGSCCYQDSLMSSSPHHHDHHQQQLGGGDNNHTTGGHNNDALSLDGGGSVVSATVSVMSPGNFYSIPTWYMPE